MEHVIETQNLSKQYGKTMALDNVNLKVGQGDIYGLIGRNGAGKTTLMKIINRQIHATNGSLKILGETIGNKDNINLKIGTLIEAPGIYPTLTAKQNLDLKCRLIGYKPEGYIESLLELVNLTNTGNKKAKNFSLGMKQRLGLALALVGEPDVLLLDEPTNGMDPQGIQEFRETVLRLNKEKNISVVISSHILGELSKFITKLGIIHEGKLIKESNLNDLEHENQDHITIKSANVKNIVTFLEDKLNIKSINVVSNNEINIFESLDKPEFITHELIKAGILFDSIHLERFSLEDMFLNLTGGVKHA